MERELVIIKMCTIRKDKIAILHCHLQQQDTVSLNKPGNAVGGNKFGGDYQRYAIVFILLWKL